MSGYRSYSKYKPSGAEWLGEVPDEWEVKPLKFAANLLTRRCAGRRKAIGLENIESWSGRFIETESEFEGEGVAVEAGDILFGKLRPYLAKALLVTESSDAVGDFHAMRPQHGTNAQFLLYKILSKEFIVMVDGSTFGSKMPRASWEFVGKMPIPLPPLPEQIQIATFLDRECGKLDDLQAKQERLIELLKEKRQALISHAVTKGLDPNAKLKLSGIEWIGDVPEGWVVPYFGLLIAKAELGGNYDGSEGDDGIPLIKMGNLDRGFIKLNKIECLPENQAYDRAFILKDGDFLFNTRNSLDLVGKVAVWRSELPLAIYNSNILRIAFRKQKVADSAFMSYFFNSDLGVSQLRLAAKGTTSVAAIYYKDCLFRKICGLNWHPSAV